ncbi:MAG: hypothetical protein J7539_03660 [Niabella sp.]|nr:hypothetical protein [Niabella sp.]
MKNTAIAMQEKCPHCNQIFQLDAATKWLVERAVQNKLKDINITCTACNKQVLLPLGQPPVGLPDKKEQFIRPAAVSWQGQKRYRVTVASAVNFLSGTIAQNESELLWELRCSPAAPDQLMLQQLSKKIIVQDSQMKAFNLILDIANEPAAALHFRVNREGGLATLLNADAIEKHWTGTKFDKLQEHLLTNPWLEEVIKGFDEEYRDFFKSVQRNPLYYLFFLPTGKMERSSAGARPLAVSWQRLSQLFAPHFIDLEPAGQQAFPPIPIMQQGCTMLHWLITISIVPICSTYKPITLITIH